MQLIKARVYLLTTLHETTLNSFEERVLLFSYQFLLIWKVQFLLKFYQNYNRVNRFQILTIFLSQKTFAAHMLGLMIGIRTLVFVYACLTK